MKNVAASVRARLMNQARSSGVTLPSLIERFAMGRLLWRLSQDAHADRFVLKGAQLFSLWADQPHRPTRDLDLLSFGDPSSDRVKEFFEKLTSAPVEPDDGLQWDRVEVSRIREGRNYEGVRITTKVTLDGAVVPVQVDLGFGDAITPAPVERTWVDLLGFPETRLLTYPPETVIAEKLEAAVDLGILNSRMKDFFDLQWLSCNMEFDRETLADAVQATFARRGTTLPSEPPLALTPEFGTDPTKITQWKAFLRKSRLEADPFPQVIAQLSEFLLPLLASQAEHPPSSWKPDDGWIVR